MNKNYWIIIIVLALFLNYSVVNADMGPKPSITIRLLNMKTSNYLIDILVYDESGKNYDVPINYNGSEGQYNPTTGYNDLSTITIEQLEILHSINYDGWISESTRWNPYLLMAECRGNVRHTHYFRYFGIPDTYKVVIINNYTGEIKITDVIHRDEFNSNVVIDVNSMDVVSKADTNNSILYFSIVLLSTIFIELIVALVMKVKNIKTIVLVNLVTNIVLQLVLYISVAYLPTLVVMEIIIFNVEYFIYSKLFVNVSKDKIKKYIILAILINALLIFIV